MTKKRGKNHFGHKLHASIGKRHKLVRKVIITNAALSDSVVFEELLDPNNPSRDSGCFPILARLISGIRMLGSIHTIGDLDGGNQIALS